MLCGSYKGARVGARSGHYRTMTHAQTLDLRTQALSNALAAAGVPVPTVLVVEEAASTNTELAALVDGSDPQWRETSVLVARHQSAGRGRIDRSWDVLPNSSFTFSLHIELDLEPQAFTWVPLAVGAILAEELGEALGVDVGVKWPNDLVVRNAGPELEGWLSMRKVGGILVQRVGTRSVIVGVGINATQDAEQLPVPTATSLALALGERQSSGLGDGNELLAGLIVRIINSLRLLERAGGDPGVSGLHDRCVAQSVTLGTSVRAELTDGTILFGMATGLAADGGLIVAGGDGEELVVTSGDVYHLRLH